MKKEVIEARVLAARKAFAAAKEKNDGIAFVDAVADQFEAILRELQKDDTEGEDPEVSAKFEALQKSLDAVKDGVASKAQYDEVIRTITEIKAGLEKPKEAERPSLRAMLEKNKEALKSMPESRESNLKFEAALTEAGSIVGPNRTFFPAPAVDNVIAKPASPVRTVLQDVNVGPTDSPRIVYVDRSPINGQAAFIEEGALKPALDWTYTPSTAEVVKIAATVKISNEMLEDVDFIEGEIRTELYDELYMRISQELVVHQAANTAAAGKLATLTGIGTAYANPGFAGQVANPTTQDAIYAAVSQLRQLGYTGPFTAYVPQIDADLMIINKDSTGQPLNYSRQLEGVVVRGNPDLTGGQFVVGDFSKFNVKMRKNITIDVGYGITKLADGTTIVSDWEANFVTFRGEARLASYVKTNDKNAFVVDNLDTVKASIAKV